MVSFMKKQVLIFNSVVNFMLSFKIRCNIQFLQAKCNSYWVQKVSLCRYFFCYFKAAQSLQRMLLKLKSSMVIQISFLHRINRCLRNPPSAFSSVYLWSGTDTTLFILQSLTLPAGPSKTAQTLAFFFNCTRTHWKNLAISVQTALHTEGNELRALRLSALRIQRFHWFAVRMQNCLVAEMLSYEEERDPGRNYLLRGWWSTETGYPKKLRMPHPCKCSRPGWMELWATWSSGRCPSP